MTKRASVSNEGNLAPVVNPDASETVFNEHIPPPPPPSSLRLILNNIICGAIAGVVAKTAVAPAERVKMSYQTTGDLFTLGGALNRAKGIVQDRGLFSLWRGHSTTVLRVAPFAGLSYACHDYMEREFKRELSVNKLPFLYKFTAGALGGGFATLLTYPLDVLRVRLALVPDSTYLGTIKQGGLFQGLVPTMLGIIPYSGTAWAVKQYLFEKYKQHATEEARKEHEASRDNESNVYQGSMFLPREKINPNLWESLIMNAIAGLSGQFVTYPLDIVRRRMQMAVHVEGIEPKGMLHTLRTLKETEGFRGLSKGFSLNIIKGPITMSISLTMYDMLRKKLFLDESFKQ